jgi:hypothetical protein
VGEKRVYGEFVGRVTVKAAARSPHSKAGLKPRHYIQGVIADDHDDSRFSAISSILVMEFQLRPVQGVFRIL